MELSAREVLARITTIPDMVRAIIKKAERTLPPASESFARELIQALQTT